MAFGPGGHHRRGILSRRRRGERRRRGAARRPKGSGSGPTRSRSRRALSRAWPSAPGAPSPRDTSAASASAAAWCCSTQGGAAPGRPDRGQGGRCHERGLRPRGHHRRGISFRSSSAASAAWCCSTRRGSGSGPTRSRSRRAVSRAWPSAPGAPSPRDTSAAASAAWCCSTRRGSGSGPTRSRSRRAVSRAWPSAPGAPSPRDTRGDVGVVVGVGGVVLLDARGSGSGPTDRGQGGRCHERGLRPGGHHRRGILAASSAAPSASAAWCCSTRGGAAPGRPDRGQGGRCHERGLRPRGHHRRGIQARRRRRHRRRRRRGAARREEGAALGRPDRGQGGRCHERGLRPGGHHRRGIRRGGGGGVVLLDGDPASWRAKARQVANRNFTRGEWRQFFPDTPYRRTIRSFPWPHDLPEAERKQTEAWEKEHPVVRDAS